MKFDFKKLSKNVLIQSFITSIILIGIWTFIIECPPENYKTCYFLIILGAMFNCLPRKDDSKFSQIRTPLITSFVIIINKMNSAVNFIVKPEIVENYNLEDMHFENSFLVMIFCGVFFLFILGLYILFLLVFK